VATILEMTAPLRAVALDVDGVLTDGGFWLGSGGEEWKRFCFADVMGISLARKAGLVVALISGEDSQPARHFAAKLGITDIAFHCKDKVRALGVLARRHALSPGEISFMGDDVNDLPALEACGFAAAPADARQSVLDRVDFVTKQGGGRGAVRELVDLILANSLRLSPSGAAN
jgi:3-deoxy-D-manno-octulosonate 8-phosphate phosphatase (KDO 8-P phosphatase)